MKSYKVNSVLIVDNNRESCVFIEQIMERLRLKMKSVDNFKSAYDLVKTNIFGKLNYNFFIINSNIDYVASLDYIEDLHRTFKKKVKIVVIYNSNDMNIINEFRRNGADLISKLDNLQSTLFNLSLKYKNKDLLIEDDKNKKPLFYGHRIMLVEDNSIIREIVKNYLCDLGFTIDMAFDGEKAVKYFMESEPRKLELILMDIQMPNMNGYLATEAIRNCSREDGKTIPIIAMTANTLSIDRKKCFEVGMNDYITKPISLKRFNEILEKYIKISV